PWPYLAPLIALAAALAAVGLYFAVTRTNIENFGGSAAPSARSAEPARLAAVGAFDPQGNDGEHDAKAGLATDGDLATAWDTETYDNFAATKNGVGLVLRADRPVRLTQLIVSSPSRDVRAEIQAGQSRLGPFDPVSPERTLGPRTAFTIKSPTARYYVVWITEIPPFAAASISEVGGRR
ncbi:MAG: hypothetical protein M3540_10535, partial [Actinomycetota bacterium]|nr:hypothetical protein [Actinomycetota bacterium]